MIGLLIKLRNKLYTSHIKSKFGYIGKNFSCQRGLVIGNGKNISLGDNVTINRFCTLKAAPKLSIGNKILISNFCVIEGDIEMGNKVVFAPFCHVTSVDHDYKGDIFKVGKSNPIKIGNNVWIASGVKIVKGVSIGDNCVLGAGSVVTKDIPNNSIAVGVPAKVIKKI